MRTSSNTTREPSGSSLVKALDTLTLLTCHPAGLRLYEIVEYMHLPRPSVVRILQQLVRYGLVIQQGRQYSLSERFHEWSHPERHALLRRRYRPLLEAVSRATGELVLLGLQQGNAIVHIDVIESDQVVRVAPAPTTRHNLQTSALGKLALSRTPHLRRRVTSPRLRRELAEIDRTGIAWNREESNKGVIAVATWGFDRGAAEPMIAVAWPAFRFAESSAAKALRAIRALAPAGFAGPESREHGSRQPVAAT